MRNKAITPPAGGSRVMSSAGTATPRIGSLGQPAPTIGGDLADPSRAPLSSVRKLVRTAGDAVTRKRRSAEGEDDTEDRLSKIEDAIVSIGEKLESMAPDEEPESSEDDDAEAESSEDNDTEVESSEDDESKPASTRPASSEQIRAACSGASDTFVLTCVEQGLTAKQAAGMFKAQQSKVPPARGRKPVKASRGGGGGSSSVAEKIQALAAENIAKGMSKNDAIGTAMNAVKKVDPEGVLNYVNEQQQAHRRSMIGAAAAG